MISIATGGKFWPQHGGGGTTTTVINRNSGGYSGGGWDWDRKPPVVIIDAVREKDIEISVTVIGVEDA